MAAMQQITFAMNAKKILSVAALSLFVATAPAALANHGHKEHGKQKTKIKRNKQQKLERFDTNRDGVVSRSEFPGDANQFDRADLNRDGVITHAEAREVLGNRTERRNAGSRFKGMDRNADGFLTRDEWRGNDQSFRNHDRNNDGVLSGDELRGKGRGR